MEIKEIDYKRVFDSGPNALVIVSKDYIILGFNRVANNYFEDILEEKLLANESIFKYFNEDNGKNIKCSLNEALKGNIVEYEVDFKCKRGRKNWFEFCYSPIYKESGEVISVSISAKPIRKRKLVEEAFIRRLAFEKLISKISKRLISLANHDEAIIKSLEDMVHFSGASRAHIYSYCNKENRIEKIYEWRVEKLLKGDKDIEKITPDAYLGWINQLNKRQIILVKDVSSSTVVLPIFVQRELYGFIEFETSFENSGWHQEDISLLKVISEIFSSAFERIEVEAALKKSEEKFRELFHNANDFICVHTFNEEDQMRFIEVNDFACKKTGYTREEALAIDPKLICGPDFVDKIPSLQNIIKECGHITYEMDIIIKGGSKITLEMNSHLLNLGNEAVVMTLGRDISERVLMDKAIKQKNEILQETIIKLKETQSRLIQQEQLAAIGQLAAGVAHEINNPLGFIISNCSTLQNFLETLSINIHKQKEVMVYLKALDLTKDVRVRLDEIEDLEKQNAIEYIMEDLPEILKDIQEGLQRVEDIVKGLSIFARVDEFLELKDFDLHEGIKSTLNVAINEYKYHTVISSCLNPIPKIKGMPGQINQIILNLILNAAYAIKAKYQNESKKGLIKVTTYHDRDFVYCEIEDNGIGIAEENIRKIFNPFFTTKPVGEGTGLGLSIVYDIMVNKHHGEIDVESTLHVGTKFTLKFPIVSE
ncbi:ATP-binding protein [Alkaliphilus transvaalensis]|uniref:ATP-binding protein n=1 Tax=Alkaliphilus transvaalensis TaxID=114628 RepID=UPI0006851C4D|nr:ATP-binding protein [Alkaliphilus transvaalensis]